MIAILGDSVSDQGNTFAASGIPPAQFYYQGRFSNGPNWVDHLTTEVRKMANVEIWNYATGGATACSNARLNSIFPFIKPLANQTAELVRDIASGRLPTAAKLLPIQFISVNDVEAGLSDLTGGGTRPPAQSDVVQLITNITRCRMDAVLNLAATGVAKDIVLLPTSPAYLAPSIPDIARPLVKGIVDALDAAVAQGVNALQTTVLDVVPSNSPLYGTKLHLLGNSVWIERLVPRVRPPLTNTTAACFNIPSVLLPIPPGVVPCSNPNDYWFYDTIHPTTNFARYFAVEGVLPRLQQLRLLPY